MLGVCSFFNHQQRFECQLRRLLVEEYKLADAMPYKVDPTLLYSAYDRASPRLRPSLIARIQVEIGKLHDYRATYTPTRKHYDYGRNQGSTKDDRRLILSAECQVGKTGAYLHYLKLLTRAASTVAVPPPLPVDRIPSSRGVVGWLLPHWKKLFDEPSLSPMYGTLLASKYTEGVANARAYLVALSCKSGGSWVHNFQELLRNVSGETITSKAGKNLVEKLGNKLVDADAPFDIEGRAMRTKASLEELKKSIDWDGRFRGHGVHLCICQGECTPRCQETMAHVSYGTVLQPIRTADLAETGGQHDAVRARWEDLHQEEDLSHGEKWPFVVTGVSWCAQQHL